MANPVAQLQDALNRIAALEEARIPIEVIDYSDPQLSLVKADGTPIDPSSIEKIPDIVKDLPIFEGSPSEVYVWLNDAESLVSLYKPTAGSTVEQRNRYHMVCKTIRRKIRGEANDALVASNVTLNFELIKRTLETYYGEKRDIGTLDYQLMGSQQRGRPLEKYYDEVNRLLSLIANQIKSDSRYQHPEAARAMINNYNEKALDCFIRGLDQHSGKYIKTLNPKSLASAYALCIQFQNLDYRDRQIKPKPLEIPQGPRNLIPNQRLPPHPPPRPHRPMPLPHPLQSFRPIPPRANQQQKPEIINYKYGHGLPIMLQYQSPPYPKPSTRENPFIPKSEPMEVDPSIRTRQINYANRPNNSYQQRPPLKRQRMYNITTDEVPQSTVSTITEEYQEEPDDQTIPIEDQAIPNTPDMQRFLKIINNQDQGYEFDENEAEFNFLG